MDLNQKRAVMDAASNDTRQIFDGALSLRRPTLQGLPAERREGHYMSGTADNNLWEGPR
jgi:hypothetical protein